jgi:hypothetical protein
MTRTTTLAVFAVLGAAFAAWSAYTVVRPEQRSIVQLIDRVGRSRLGRWALLLGWAWLGWHLFARGSGAFE